MSKLEALALKDAQLPKIKVNATVIFSILNNFMGRSPRDARVIGTLLGEVKDDGTVVVSECFAVPFSEKTDERYVAINQEYHKQMYAFHRRNNKKEYIVGWYTTTTLNGQFIVDTSSLFHDFYTNECANPVHLVVDTTLMTDKINARGFVSKQLVLGDEVLANTFEEIFVDIALTEAEATCLYHMIQQQDPAEKWKNSTVTSTIPTSATRVEDAICGLQKVLDDIQMYVDGVVDGKIPPSREIGIAVADALNAFAAQKALLSQQTSFSTRVQDLLMISYITTLTQTQTLISEKLNEIL